MSSLAANLLLSLWAVAPSPGQPSVTLCLDEATAGDSGEVEELREALSGVSVSAVPPQFCEEGANWHGRFVASDSGVSISVMTEKGRLTRRIPGLDSSTRPLWTLRARGELTSFAAILLGLLLEARTASALDGESPERWSRSGDCLTLEAGRDASVRFTGEAPPLCFTWPARGTPPYRFELAASSSFQHPVHSSSRAEPFFTAGRLAPGSYVWRVRLQGKWIETALALGPYRKVACERCSALSVVDDTGEHTVLYFQHSQPEIALRWRPVTHAQRYRVRVYSDGRFDKPELMQVVSGPSFIVAAGRLREGRYFWQAQALAEDGHELNPGRVNPLSLIFDNGVKSLEIHAPQPGASLKPGRSITEGEVELGSKLFIDGTEARVDAKGRFRVPLAIKKGPNRVVYRVAAAGKPDRYYVLTLRGR